ncbi:MULTISPECIES: Y-family DNA polymerase [Ramlibacter]|uniref:Y-family DNA polymerase n=1 Tax=Ramlibacter TaxID=174951 RepID=UPI0015EE9D2A|nr:MULTISPECIES: DNA polymerase Y family protein [Ramlibacter]MBA2963553.1 DNA polymerase Y family protein [Ramlibacter sp. CGMCC 1.13660]
MFWIALCPFREQDRQPWTWWALRFTPRVTHVDEAVLLEVSGSLRLFGGRQALLHLLLRSHPDLGEVPWAAASTSLVALALLRCKQRGIARPAALPDDLPLELLGAALPHVALLERTGTRTWGQVRAMPRGGLSRRFGADLLAALDSAFGERPETYPWQVLPEAFDLNAELAALASTAPELLLGAEQLLARLQVWLQARNRGVLALELEWTLDLRRLNGVKLPPREQLQVRTAQPTQDMAHLRRLVREHLERATLAAPANHLRLRSLETVPWAGATTSLLPQEQGQGEKLHQLVERLSVRLGEENVVVPVPQADHRPECKQAWKPAREGSSAPVEEPDALYPSWVLPQPLRLRMQGETPCFGGPLRRLARLYRVETAWWDGAGPTLRDYFVARSPRSGLVWIFRERPCHLAEDLAQARQFAWYLQGLYA